MFLPPILAAATWAGRVERPGWRRVIGRQRWAGAAKPADFCEVFMFCLLFEGKVGAPNTAGSTVAAPRYAYPPTRVPSLTSEVVGTAGGRKPRAIIQTASTISCTARGMNIRTCWDELAPMTAYIASRSATT